MNKQQAIEFSKKYTKNKNLIKHMLAVGACMRGLAIHFGESEAEQEKWEVAGIVHDADYETLKDDGDKHPSLVFGWLEEEGVEESIINAVKAHAWGFSPICKEPSNNMEGSIYCCDELTGLIIAVALVRPSRKLADVDVSSVMKKWHKKDFAAGVIRENTELCEKKMGIKLEDFIDICIKSLQSISDDLGL